MQAEGAQPTAQVTVLDEDDEEDAVSAKPIAPPAPLEVPCLSDVPLNVGPNKLYQMLVKADSEFMKKLGQQEVGVVHL